VTQPDPEAAVAFYSGLFGWECEDVMPPESEARYFVARLRGRDVAAVGSIEVAAQAAMWNTYFWVDSADETVSKVREAGGSVLMEPFDIGPDAGRKAVCTDREGAAFCVWQARSNTQVGRSAVTTFAQAAAGAAGRPLAGHSPS
jgi:predicted enzyme related to lactoylglutathione lyase